ncbi:MAG TPA: TolC family protein [Gemmataceae bacterium]|nr:TolC family protein [Gemmataceae bacterium]
MRWLIVPVLMVSLGCRSCPSDPQGSAVAPQVHSESRSDSATKDISPLASEPSIVPCSATESGERPASAGGSSSNQPADTGRSPDLPPPARLEQPPENNDPAELVAGGKPLTLNQLEQIALRRNPTLPQAAALVQQQEGLRRQAGLYPNPVAGYIRSDADRSGESLTNGVFLSQTIITAGKLRLGRAEGTQEVIWRTWHLNAQQFRVLNDVRIRFYELLGAQKAVEAAAEQVRLAEDGVRAAEQLLKTKQGSRPDLLEAEMQLSAARTAHQDAQYREQSARQQLANVVGVAELPPVPVAGSLEENVPELDWQKEHQRLLESSPLLKAQEAEIRAAQYELRLARAQAVPDVNVQVVDQRDHILKFTGVTTLISMPIPVFNRNQGNIVNAQGILRQAQWEYDRLRLAITDQLSISFRSYLTLRTQAERLRKEVLPRAKENLDLTIQANKMGRFDFMRVLAARREFAQANLGYIDALTELHKVLVEIDGLQLTGGLNPTEVGVALQTSPGAATTGLRGVILQLLQEQRRATTVNLPGAVQAGEH